MHVNVYKMTVSGNEWDRQFGGWKNDGALLERGRERERERERDKERG